MTIHGLNSIASRAMQVGTGAAAGSRVGQETKVAPSTAATSAPSPAAIYHPSQNDSASGLAGPGDIKAYSWAANPEEHTRMIGELMQIWGDGLPAVSAGLRSAYDSAIVDLPPELLQKDWGFSVSDGQLIILEGSDALSDEERSTLKRALAELTPAANAVAETTTRMITLDRGTYGVSNSIGRFDVTTKNFADIVDLRKYLSSHGPNRQYDMHAKNPADLKSVYGTGGHAMMDQIAANASVRFAVSRIPFGG